MGNFSRQYHRVPLHKKASLAVLGFIALSIPVSVYTVVHQIRTKSFAAESALITSVDTPDNLTPILSTGHLSEGSVNQNYSMTVTGFDPDINDALKMTVFGLPPGFKVTNCQPFSQSDEPNYYSCLISGTPKQTGNYHVYITLSDDHHAYTQTRHQLRIK